MTKLKYLIPFYLSIVLYLAALTQPYFVSAGNSEFSGIFMVLMGWLFGVNDLFTFLAWFANISFIVSIITVAKRKKEPKKLRGLIFSIITVVFALCGFFAGDIHTEIASQTMANSSFGLGFYLWFLSFVLMLASMFLRIQKPKEIIE